MSVSRFGELQANAYLGSAHDNSPFGKIWYVDVTNGSDGNSGEAPDEAVAGIAAAISRAVATRGDSVHIAPGTYTITSALSPKAFMTFRAAVLNPAAPSVSIRGNIVNLMKVDVNGCRFIGLEFRATGQTVNDMIKLADTTAITGGVTFEDCVFNGNDIVPAATNGVGAIWANDATNAVTGLVIRRCLFRDLGATCLEVGVQGIPYAKIEDNVFAIDTNLGVGISLEDTAAYATGKGYTIRNNEFIGPDATTTSQVGIRLVGTENQTGAGIIRNNYFSFFSIAPITADKLEGSIITNYYGGTTGGDQVVGGV
jgi:hypothetical protein